ncbi:GntR family transcriptional regulator [Vibrio sp. TBV020]|uniref:GntR family transcriptional regulator n=1 Tax=Vibrio sp. TBV020 TaxID=3137398 RepID=UPI0038CD4799
MDVTAITRLQKDLLVKVVTRLKKEGLQSGDSLNESSLAQQFEVSRTPMRAVLKYLSQLDVAKAVPYKGFVLQVNAADIQIPFANDSERCRQEQLYLRILMDLFFGALNTSLSEKEFQERYEANRGEIQNVLRLLETDGIFRRSPGYKWHIDGVLNTLERHAESYRCRLIFEPAGLLEPTWALDTAALEGCQERHIRAINQPNAVTASQLFDLSAEFHELLSACSGNRFLLGTMQQHNRLRKATDLVSMHIQSSVAKSCQRRLDIIELVLKGENQAAATKLTQLLENDIRVMTRTYNDVMNVPRQQRETLIRDLTTPKN